MGSAYTTIAADALARYHRLCQKQVTFVTGTDEHGEKIAESARAKGVEPQQHCDGIVESFKSLWEQVTADLDLLTCKYGKTQAQTAILLASRCAA